MIWPRIYLVLALRALSLGTVARADPMPASRTDVLDQIDGLVRARFYDPALLPQRGWDQAVRETRAVLATAPADRRREILARLVARLQTSHTEYIAPDDPRYAQILSIFEGGLASAHDRCPDLSKLPPLPIEVPDIGVWWTRLDGRWFVGGVLDDGPAKRAGLVLGDEVVSANGSPFQPVAALASGPGKPVTLRVQRSRDRAQRCAAAAVLINRGSRSGKEAIAYGVKQHHLAKLVGERTGGAVLAGGIFCLEDGAVLYLASGAVTVDGEVLEGKGVAPDVAVPFDIRYAAGRDLQLEAALDALAAR